MSSRWGIVGLVVLAVAVLLFPDRVPEPGLDQTASETGSLGGVLLVLPAESQAVTPRIEGEREGGQISRSSTEIMVLAAADGSRVAGAGWAESNGTGLRGRSGETDASGTAMVQLSEDSKYLAFWADGFVGTSLPVEQIQKVTEVFLEPSVTLVGEVRDVGGMASPSGIRIVAYEANGPIPALDLVQEGYFCAQREVEVATTDASGEFSLRRLRLNADYILQAIGQGIVGEPVRIKADESLNRIKLLAGAVRFADIRVVDAESGAPLRSHPMLRGQSIGLREVLGEHPHGKLVHLGEEVLRLAGITRSLKRGEHEWRTTAVVGFRENGPCTARVSVNLPGYLPADEEVALYPPEVQHSPWEIALVGRGLGWGSISVNLQDLDAPEYQVPALGPDDLVLRLVSHEAAELGVGWIDLPIAFKEGPQLFSGVPSGLFDAKLRLRNGFDTVHPNGSVSVRVQNEGTGYVAFSMRDRFALQFLLSDTAALQHRGPFEGVLIRHFDDRSERISFYFPGPPYTFVALPPGEYSLMTDPPVMFPPPADPREAGAKFMVGPETAGVVHDLEVVF